jgi:DNA-binding CsgD family transcriptional regulator
MLPLNERQRDVLCLVCKGLTNAEIARQMGLSARTVKGYVCQLLLIHESSNRTELVGTVLSASRGEFSGPTGRYDRAVHSDVDRSSKQGHTPNVVTAGLIPR